MSQPKLRNQILTQIVKDNWDDIQEHLEPSERLPDEFYQALVLDNEAIILEASKNILDIKPPKVELSYLQQRGLSKQLDRIIKKKYKEIAEKGSEMRLLGLVSEERIIDAETENRNLKETYLARMQELIQLTEKAADIRLSANDKKCFELQLAESQAVEKKAEKMLEAMEKNTLDRTKHSVNAFQQIEKQIDSIEK